MTGQLAVHIIFLVKWIVVIGIMAGLFYLGKQLMPSPTAIDVTWMQNQVKPQMTEDEVQHIIGGNPSQVQKNGIGRNETWYYEDRYDPTRHLSVEFVEGRVLRTFTDK